MRDDCRKVITEINNMFFVFFRLVCQEAINVNCKI